MPWPLHRGTHSPVGSALGSLSSLGRGRCCSRALRCSSSRLLLVVSHSGTSSRMLSSPSVGQEFPSRGCHCLNSPITALEVLNSILLFTFGSSTGAQTVTTHKARCQQGRCPRIICWWNIYFRETYRARSKRQMTSSSYPPNPLRAEPLGQWAWRGFRACRWSRRPWLGLAGVGWCAGPESRVPCVCCFPWKIHRVSRELWPQAWVGEKASASQDGPRLPTGTHQHCQQQPRFQTHVLQRWPASLPSS